MISRILTLALFGLALTLAPASLLAKETPKTSGPTHDGKVVSVKDDKLVMSIKEGSEHSHTLAADAKVTCDGKVCKLADLKAGWKIRVTTAKDDKQIATHVEAINKHTTFAHTHDGKIVSLDGAKLKMTDSEGANQNRTIAKDATLTLDGKECKLAHLKAGMKIRITTHTDDKSVVTVVEALDKNAEFGS